MSKFEQTAEEGLVIFNNEEPIAATVNHLGYGGSAHQGSAGKAARYKDGCRQYPNSSGGKLTKAGHLRRGITKSAGPQIRTRSLSVEMFAGTIPV